MFRTEPDKAIRFTLAFGFERNGACIFAVHILFM
jgi:hypothetical protein